MGLDPMAVVDAEIARARIDGLRMVDASRCRRSSAATPTFPTMMIAERAAEMISASRKLTASGIRRRALFEGGGGPHERTRKQQSCPFSFNFDPATFRAGDGVSYRVPGAFLISLSSALTLLGARPCRHFAQRPDHAGRSGWRRRRAK